jgi:hypothetical protein
MNNPVWQVILGLSRYPIFLTTEHTEHTETNSRTVLSCFRVFGVFRGSLLFGDKIEDVVAETKVICRPFCCRLDEWPL